MVLPPKLTHPMGEAKLPEKTALFDAVEVDTYAGKVHVEWDQSAAVTPISTSIRGQRTEIPVKDLEKPSVVASNLIQTLSWKDRRVKFIKEAENNIIEQVILSLIPIIGADKVIENNLE